MNEAEKSVTEVPRAVKLTPRQLSNFWPKIDKISSPHGCWLWTAYKDKNGYGKFGVGHGDVALAHRVAYVLLKGEPPSDKPFLLHNCPGGDNSSCCNPDHIWPGTQTENISDMMKKGRANQWAHQTRPEEWCGENNPRSKMTVAKVIKIRKMREQGATLLCIAETFQMSIPGVHHIITRKMWKHVP